MSEIRRSTVRGAGLDLAVFERGTPDTGPTVVLVHGYPDTHVVWDAVAERLADRFHVVTYDVRGAGASGTPQRRADWDLELLVADLAAVADACAPGRPVHLVGHDWGSIQSWEAVCAPAPSLAGRIASYTTISGPSLDHVAAWMQTRRARFRTDRTARRQLLTQAVHSWYILVFQLPLLAPLAWRTVAASGFRRVLAADGVPVDDDHPAPTLAADGARGVGLYRRNIPRRMCRPQTRTTDVPVQVVVLERDRFVTPALLDDVGDHADDVTRVRVDAGHWAPMSHPDRIADLVAEHAGRS